MIIMNKHKNDNVYINNKYAMYVMIIMNKHENNNNDSSTKNKMPKYSICIHRGPPVLSLPGVAMGVHRGTASPTPVTNSDSSPTASA